MRRVENSVRRHRPNRRPSHPFANMDAEELEQLAPYMGLSGSDSDVKDNDSSESDDEFQSRAQIESGSERRKTRSPSVSPYRPTQKTQTQPGRKRKKKKRKASEEHEDGPEDAHEDIREDEPEDSPKDNEESPEDDHLAKFFAADAELSDHNENVSIKKKSKSSKKKKKSEEKKNEMKVQKTVKNMKTSSGTSSASNLKEMNSRKRKSGTPRKLEVIDETKMDSWETAEDTEIVKNSSNDKDYLIKERKSKIKTEKIFEGPKYRGYYIRVKHFTMLGSVPVVLYRNEHGEQVSLYSLKGVAR